MFGKQITLFEILGFKVQLDFSWIFLALLVTWSLAYGYFPTYYLGLPDSTYWWMGAGGCVSSKQIVRIPRDQWKRLTVRDVATPCSADNTISAASDALTALSIMNRTSNGRLMVMEGKRLVGVVKLKNLLKLLTLKLDLQGVA